MSPSQSLTMTTMTISFQFQTMHNYSLNYIYNDNSSVIVCSVLAVLQF
jgi:hypothetical protein